MTCRCESFKPGITRRPLRSITVVCGPCSYSSASSTAAMRPSLMATFLASGYLGSRVVMRPLWRIRSGIIFALMRLFTFSGMKPIAQYAGHERHHQPREQYHHAGVEQAVTQQKMPGPDG